MDRNEKIWAWSNTGTKIHAFIERGGVKRVGMCRSNMYRSSTAAFDAIDNLATGHKFNVCTRCLELAEAMWDRAEASMQPATESHDLGYVAWEGKFTDAQRDAMQDEFDAAVAAAQAPKVDEAETATVAKFTDALRDAVQTFSSLRSPIASASSAFGAWVETATVDRSDEKIWAYVSKGLTAHAFIAPWSDKNGKESADYLRAVCRSTIFHHVDLSRSVKDAAINVCGTCEMKLAAFEKEATALYDRAVAAMRPAIQGRLMDALHAEALEMDELETALAAGEPQRFHYRAVLATTGGTPLDGIEGYINALDRDAAEAMLQERYQTDLIRLTSLHINLA